MQILAAHDIIDGELFNTSSRAVIGPAQKRIARHLFKLISCCRGLSGLHVRVTE